MPISRDLYSFKFFQLRLSYCELRINFADILFLNNLLNSLIVFAELLSVIHFNISNRYLKISKLFFDLFYKNNYCATVTKEYIPT